MNDPHHECPLLDLIRRYPELMGNPIENIARAIGPVPASDIVELPNGVQFRLPIGQTKGMNQGRITHDHHGTYTLTFERIKRSKTRGIDAKPYGEFKGVRLEDLKATFYEATGLPPAE